MRKGKEALKCKEVKRREEGHNEIGRGSYRHRWTNFPAGKTVTPGTEGENCIECHGIMF